MRILSAIISILGCALLWGAFAPRAVADPNPYALPPVADHHSLPPFIIQNSPLPNVLLILDNSNSMDESPDGEPVGSFHGDSRSEIARQALRRIIEKYGESMRIGLMAYRQGPDIQSAHLHTLRLYASYDKSTYDPQMTVTPQDPRSNTRRIHNSTYGQETAPYDDDDHYVYYDRAVASYLSARFPDLFCYSTNFVPRPLDPQPEDTAECSVNWYDKHICSDAPYRCYTGKVGEEDIEPDGVCTEADDLPAMAEHIGEAPAPFFHLADSGVAGNIYQLGAQVAISYVGDAWVSSVSPGGGELVVKVADPDAAHEQALFSRIAPVTQYEEPYDMTQSDPLMLPIRNAGLTPLYSSLGSARSYFAGGIDSHETSVRYTSPITHECQKNFIVVVTDGLPTEDPYGNGDAIAPVAEAAAALRRTEVVLDGVGHRFDIQTFVLGFALPKSAAGALDAVAIAGGTDLDGRAYYADDEAQLEAALGRLFNQIGERTVSGSAAAVVSDARTGQGAVYQAVFYPLMTDGTWNVRWAGDVRGLFVDASGYMHESLLEPDGSGDQVLQEPSVEHPMGGDPIITMCTDETNGVVRVHKARQRSSIPTGEQIRACDSAVFPDGLADVKWLWSGGQWLAELSDATTQRVYDQADRRRYLITGIDTPGGDGQIGADQEQPFVASIFDSGTAGLLQAGDVPTAERIVHYIRGADQPGMRSRQIDYDQDGVLETWPLGDIVYATPVVVGRPAENLDILYRDASYRSFAATYRNRRRVVIAGANDGMLHAFNGGCYDAARQAFRRGNPPHELGAELWAYIPYNLLPHLRYITYPTYGSRGGEHLYFVDLQPVVFDARVFENGGLEGQPGVEHPSGWGTLLVGGMRFGGREIRVEANPNHPGSDTRTLRSAYFILDITDPEKPPKLLLEFTHPDLGYTTSRPTPLKAGNRWYLMLGSGPYPANAETLEYAGSSQNGRLFLLDLKRMALEENFGEGGVLSLSQPLSFVSDLVAVDFDLGDEAYSTDAVYFGTVSGSRGSGWAGNLQRVHIPLEGNPPTPIAAGQWAAHVLSETGKPMGSAVNIGLDAAGNRWVFAGSGRYLTPADSLDKTGQLIFGIKEPCVVGADHQRAFSWGKADRANLRDVTPVEIFTDDPVSRTEFETLRTDMAEHFAGWYLQLPEEGERVLGQPALLADVLNFTTYVPCDEICAHEGRSYFYAVYFATGSAYYEPVIGTGGVDGGKETKKILRKIPLGKGFSARPNLYAGEGTGSKAFLQNSTGALILVEQHPPGVLKSGPIYWEAW